MSRNKKSFWLRLSLINLCIVALLGFTLRSKILFSLPFIDYRNLLSAHSHFAFGGWVGLCLITLLIYNILPESFSQKKVYQYILAGIEISSLGMAIFFPFLGYGALSIIFSSAYIGFTYFFAWIFIKDIVGQRINKSVRLLSISAIISLLASAIGPLGLAYILASKSGNSLLYRDSIYVFLHFQYNGFFTLAIFALFFDQLVRSGLQIKVQLKRFAIFLCLSVLPGLFLSLLWHDSSLYYVLAAIGSIFILLSLYYFIEYWKQNAPGQLFQLPLARSFWVMSFLSFVIKMLLNVGTIIPLLGNAVYGDRPVIIGFLHLVFLGFVTFFVLSHLLQQDFFTKGNKVAKLPFYVFATGIIANEFLLMLQGLGILFQTNSYIYSWLLWGASILLFCGAAMIAYSSLVQRNKKAIEDSMA